MTTQEQTPGPVAAQGPGRACADWLALRRDADTEARDAGAGGLLEQLVTHLRGRGAGTVRVVDVGAGTGANHAYLSPRLPFEQSWVVVDHDSDLLAHAGHGKAVRVEAGVGDLLEVLDELLAEYGARVPLVVTCTALLDVLTTEELGRLADVVERSGGPALLSLSVTGDVRWSPPDDADALVAELFDAHQGRGGRPGPRAVSLLGRDLESRGLRVVPAATPWTLDAGRADLLERWLDERVEAAAEQLRSAQLDRMGAQPDGQKGRARALADWHVRRRAQLASAGLSAHVEHVDLLVLPD